MVTFCQRKQDRNVKARPRTPVERRRSCGNGRWPGRNPAGLDDDPSVALYNISAAAPAPLQRIHTMTATPPAEARSEEHTSELQSLMRISYAVFCLQKKNTQHTQATIEQ